MPLTDHKTKIVATIGPASESVEVMQLLIRAGLKVARLNFSHGDFSSHKQVIDNLRQVSRQEGRPVAIMADLPGPKMRVGQISPEPVELEPGREFVLTTEDIQGDAGQVSVSFARLPQVVKPGDTLFLNDGLIQLEVQRVEGPRVYCRVLVGGELRSRKGLNLPGIDLGISAFTENDRKCLEFALAAGVDAVSQSFVETAADIDKVRQAAKDLGYNTYIIAKIERRNALHHLDEIIAAADGIMVARGDLGVEIPIEEIAGVQKRITRKTNLAGKPVITATQMLESMVSNRRPTRAEATDVANAILDGTDCVMLSEESAMGQYPVDAVAMLGKIAAAIEPHRPGHHVREILKELGSHRQAKLAELIALSVESTLEHITPAAVFVPTRSGTTARNIARFRPQVWIIAVSSQESTCQRLMFTYGVHPVQEPDHPDNWRDFVSRFFQEHQMPGDIVLLTEGPSAKHPEANNRMELIDLRRGEAAGQED
jgi:pyruvate kinase